MVVANKQYRFRILDKAGNFIGSPPAISMGSFRKVINGGMGEMTINLAMKFDACYTSPLTTPFNRVEVYCVDGDTDRNGVLIYSGYVNERNPYISGAEEGVRLICRGHAARFAGLILHAGTTTTLSTDTALGLTTGAGSAAAVEKVLENIIDRYNVDAVYPIINHSSSSLDASGATFLWPFVGSTLLSAINTCLNSAPAGSYWYANAANIFSFRLIGTDPDHILAFGRQINGWDDHEQLDGMVNRALVTFNSGATQNLYTDTSSSTKYGDWWTNDFTGYANSTDAQTFAAAKIHAANAPVRRLSIVVPDNNSPNRNYRNFGYDIERLEPGQMVRIVNLPAAVQQAIPDLFQITAVDYSPEQATLELVKLRDDLARDYARNIAAQQQASVNGNPATITSTVGV